jgi:hypothetical protein
MYCGHTIRQRHEDRGKLLMKVRCEKCYIKLREREISFCVGLNIDYGVRLQMCTDCITEHLQN